MDNVMSDVMATAQSNISCPIYFLVLSPTIIDSKGFA
jgi:hypothetical protein